MFLKVLCYKRYQVAYLLALIGVLSGFALSTHYLEVSYTDFSVITPVQQWSRTFARLFSFVGGLICACWLMRYVIRAAGEIGWHAGRQNHNLPGYSEDDMRLLENDLELTCKCRTTG
ncbi:MAG: hypothetical protein V1895_04160 [Parcubacteria group bacterium]